MKQGDLFYKNALHEIFTEIDWSDKRIKIDSVESAELRQCRCKISDEETI